MQAVSRGRWKAPIHSGSSGAMHTLLHSRTHATAHAAAASDPSRDASELWHESSFAGAPNAQAVWRPRHTDAPPRRPDSYEPRVSISLFVDVGSAERLKRLGGLRPSALRAMRRAQEGAIREYLTRTVGSSPEDAGTRPFERPGSTPGAQTRWGMPARSANLSDYPSTSGHQIMGRADFTRIIDMWHDHEVQL